jgi:menaquinol-cytochrome c reductase iron-sulfur subunit
LVGAVPLLSGLVVFLDPLGRKAKGGNLVRVTTLSAVPPDGRPRMFPIIAERHDAWTQYPPQPIGAVYLRRATDDQPPEAFSVVCPHLGCSVDFRPLAGNFVCPCHNSVFAVDGRRVNPATSPSPRDLDSLNVEVRNDQEVWVDYRRFVGGKGEKIEE